MTDPPLPPPFVVGATYRDRESAYTVIAVEGSTVTIERPDGRRVVSDRQIKARIYCNLVSEQTAAPARRRTRRAPTRREGRLIDRILAIEADGADHPGVEIDRQLADAARELGYTDADC